MVSRWKLAAATPLALTGLAAAAYAGSALGSGPGTPVPTSLVLCGTGSVGANQVKGASNQDHPDGSTFMVAQHPAGTQCDASNSSPGSDTWQVLHSNVDTASERGTEHGELSLGSGGQEAGFDGHITEYDLPAGSGDACTDSQGRTVYYQSGTLTDCPASFGPVGNFNTHGGAATGSHFRGRYGTIFFQQNSSSHTCDVGSTTYCIEAVLDGQTN